MATSTLHSVLLDQVSYESYIPPESDLPPYINKGTKTVVAIKKYFSQNVSSVLSGMIPYSYENKTSQVASTFQPFKALQDLQSIQPLGNSITSITTKALIKEGKGEVNNKIEETFLTIYPTMAFNIMSEIAYEHMKKDEKMPKREDIFRIIWNLYAINEKLAKKKIIVSSETKPENALFILKNSNLLDAQTHDELKKLLMGDNFLDWNSVKSVWRFMNEIIYELSSN